MDFSPIRRFGFKYQNPYRITLVNTGASSPTTDT